MPHTAKPRRPRGRRDQCQNRGTRMTVNFLYDYAVCVTPQILDDMGRFRELLHVLDFDIAWSTESVLGIQTCQPVKGIHKILSGHNDITGSVSNECGTISEDLKCVQLQGFALVTFDPQVTDATTAEPIVLDAIEVAMPGYKLHPELLGNDVIKSFYGDCSALSAAPSFAPSAAPFSILSAVPSAVPSAAPSSAPSSAPSRTPTAAPVADDVDTLKATTTIQAAQGDGGRRMPNWAFASGAVGLLALASLIVSVFLRERRKSRLAQSDSEDGSEPEAEEHLEGLEIEDPETNTVT